MLKLLLLILLCSLGYQLVRTLQKSAPPKGSQEQDGERPLDPSRAVEAQFEDVDGDET